MIKKEHRKLPLIYLGVWIFGLLYFWIFLVPGDEFAYSLLFLLHPLAIFTISILMGYFDSYGKLKWIFCIAFGVLFLLSDYLTFKLANNIASNVINTPKWCLLFDGVWISFVGLLIGRVIRWIRDLLWRKIHEE